MRSKILFALCFMFIFYSDVECKEKKDLKPLLHAMHWRESDFGQNMDGEEGSIGPYQIRKLYWQDAIEHRPEIGGSGLRASK